MDYYIFDNLKDAQDACDEINADAGFPVTGKINGVLAGDDKQKTTSWQDEPRELEDGTYAVLKMSSERFNIFNYGQSKKQERLSKIDRGKTVRALNPSHFKIEELDQGEFE